MRNRCLSTLHTLFFFLLFLTVFTTKVFALSDVTVMLTQNSTHYENTGQLVYTLKIVNNSGKKITDISVNNKLLLLETADITGASVPAFTDVSISASHSYFSKPGVFDGKGNLNASEVLIQKGGYVEYTMVATVSDTIVGDIVNDSAEVHTDFFTNIKADPVTATPVPYVYELLLSTDLFEYTITKDINYTLTVKNTGKYAIHNLALQDNVADITAQSLDGSSVNALSDITITSSSTGKGSEVGSYAATGNLTVSSASIAIGGSVSYSIKAKVADMLVGDIINQASAHTKDGNISSIVITTPPATAKISITHTNNNTKPYLVGEAFSYSIHVLNEGAGIAADYLVNQPISLMAPGLANDLTAAYNASDINGIPFDTWTVEVTNLDSHSRSALQLAGGKQQDTDLNDTVSLYPGEEIEYTVNVSISPVSIDMIPDLNAVVHDGLGVLQAEKSATGLVTEKVLDSSASDIKRLKLTNASEYVPGGEIAYDITVSNLNSKYFANNINLIDELSCVETELADGATGSAFSQWKLEVVSERGDGTDAGSYGYGIWGTAPITLVQDLAPDGELKYKLTVKVKDTAVGTIFDGGACGIDNLIENGSGVEMPDANIKIKKSVNNRYYSPGSHLSYTIEVKNQGDGFATHIHIVDPISSINTESIFGGPPIKAYASWTITAEAFNDDGSPSLNSDTGITTPITSVDLDVIARIAPHAKLVYSIDAIVGPTANGEIKNTATVNDSIYSDISSIPFEYDVTINKTVNGLNKETSYSKGDDQFIYTITVTNAKGNGFANDIQINDEISKIEAQLLHPSGTSKPVFKQWTIAAEIERTETSVDPTLIGYTKTGDFSDNMDLRIGYDGNKAAQLPPGIKIIYTITADVDRSDPDQIVYGQFANVATVKGDSFGEHSSAVSIVPKEPNIIIAKTVIQNKFELGKEVTFNIFVINKGPGYADNAIVDDNIEKMGFFDSWVITVETDTIGGTRSGHFSANNNLNTNIDIAPRYAGVDGFITYHVTGIVRSDYIKEEASNTVDLYDPVTARDSSSSAEIGKDLGVEALNVSILKVSDTPRYIPGGEIIYTIYLQNNSTAPALDLTLGDDLKAITATLANEQNGTYTDVVEASPFEHWAFDLDGTGYGPEVTENLVYPLELKAGETKTVKIRAQVKDNVISKIKNDAYIFRHKGEVTEQSHVSHHENNRVSPEGELVHTVNIVHYSPGDELIYTLKASSNAGYYNNIAINEKINSIDVLLLDGSRGNPYFNAATGINEFTVEVIKNDSHAGGTIDGSPGNSGIFPNNKDVVTTIDVGAKDSVSYVFTGNIRPDAIGDINYAGTKVKPYGYALDSDKSTEELNYEPGKKLHYKLNIENYGKGSANDIEIKDLITAVKVLTTDGVEEDAFSHWEITYSAEGKYPGYVNAGFTGTSIHDLDLLTTADIPAETTLIYTVTAVVNASAAGNIVNVLTVDGNNVSVESKPATAKFDYSKKILAYYDIDGTTVLTGGYTPGGYVEYEILLTNKSDVNIANVEIEDDIANISTGYFDGTTGPVFSGWTIITTTDSSGISDAGSVTNNSSIDTSANLAARDMVSGGTFVRYVIKAKISEKAVGSFRNSVNIANGKYNATTKTSEMLPADVKFNYQAYTDAGLGTVRNTYSQSAAGAVISYDLSLTNAGKGTAFDTRLTNLFSAIATRIAEDLSHSGNPKGLAFKSGWSMTVTDSGGVITNAFDRIESAIATDINNRRVDIAPGGYIHIRFDAVVTDNALGEIKSAAVYNGYKKSTDVNHTIYHTNIVKEIVSIASVPYAPGLVYKPGDTVVYRVTVTNPQDGWSDNRRVVDTISDVKVDVIGGRREPAFISSTISHTISNGLDSDIDTFIPTYMTGGDLNVEVDIGPQEMITFEVTGVIRDDAVGQIDGNTASVAGKESVTASIPPEPLLLEYSKILVDTSADGKSSCHLPSDSGTGCEYAPLGSLTYQVKVKNIGKGTADNIHIEDMLKAITTSGGERAFDSAAVDVVQIPAYDYDLSGHFSGDKLDANLDLKAGDEIVFELIGWVNGAATGSINNTARINGDATNRILVSQGPIILTALKTTDTPEYVPGGEVHFNIRIENGSDSNAQVALIDQISSFTVMTADGSEQPALKDWTITAKVIADSDAAYTDISDVPATGDIDSVIRLGAKHNTPSAGADTTIVEIAITGHVRDDAIGKFTNTAIIDGKRIKLVQGYITPKPGRISVTKVPVLTPALYTPGDTLSFDIRVTNSGDGYANNILLDDALDTLLTEVADNTTFGQAFNSWSVVEYDNSAMDEALTKLVVGSEINNASGYQSRYNIYPGDTVILRLGGVANANVLGDITNVINVTDELGSYRAEATYTPIKGLISVTKTVDITEYSSGDLLTYTVEVDNSSGGWANDVTIIDELTKITTEIAGGATAKAFQSVTISAVSVLGTSDISSVTAGPDLNTVVDIAPNDTIIFTLQGQLNNNLVGDVSNTAEVSYGDNSYSDDAVSKPLLADIVLNKTVDNPVYTNTGLVTYRVTIENKTNSFANGIHLLDTISAIDVETNTGASAPAFTTWSVDYSAADRRTIVTKFTHGLNQDIDVLVDLAPNDTLVFTINATVRADATGDIVNIANMQFNGDMTDKSVTITPQHTTFNATKTAETLVYQPFHKLAFRLIIENSSDNFINDMLVSDDMSAILVKYSDGSSGPAFIPGTTIITLQSSTAGTIIDRIDDISANVDIPPNGKIEFRVEGKVIDRAIGFIQNIAVVDGLDVVSPEIHSADAVVVAELSAEEEYYVPGEVITYHLKVKNLGKGIADNVFVETGFSYSKGEYIDGTKGRVFDSWNITATAVGVETTTGAFTDNKNIATVVDIDSGGYIDYTIKALVNHELVSDIDLIGHFVDLTMGRASVFSASSWGSTGTVGVYALPPVPTDIIVTKKADKAFYENNDDTVTYSLSVTNRGAGNAANVQLTDAISKLQASNGNLVFANWRITGSAFDDSGVVIDSNVVNLTDSDLDIRVNLKSSKRNRFEFEIIGTVNKGLDDDITNVFKAVDNIGKESSDSVTVHIKKIPENTGELLVIKKAMKDKAQVGDVIEYEVIVENNNESDFKRVVMEDRFPAGFQYVAHSSEIVHSGPDGEFGTGDDLLFTTEPGVTGVLTYAPFDLLATEKLRIRYLLRVSVGTTFGRYVNTAQAKIDGVTKSNLSSASVEVNPDKLFDTVSIIGKVFEDFNGDGYQADATARDIKIHVNIAASSYIANSTTVGPASRDAQIDEQVKAVNDQQPASMLIGISVDKLMGLSRNRTLPESNRVIVQLNTSTDAPFSFDISTDAGSHIRFSEAGEITSLHTGDKEAGLSSENLNVTRRLYRDGDKFLWEIEIENLGVYEDGIPGVRLLTVEGIVIETDAFGRYHVPDQWVTDKKGKNFLVKLDSDSLPTGMKVISENPKVTRITPHALAKFNFSVQSRKE